MMGMMLHMQKQTLATSLKDSGNSISVNNLHKYFTNLHNLDKTLNQIASESLKLSQFGSVDVSEMSDNASMSATSTKATSTSTFSLTFDAIKNILGRKNFTKQEIKERNALYQKMNTYRIVVAYMLTFLTEMPPEMPIDAVALGLWKLYMSEVAISIEKQVVKKFDKHNVVSKGTNKSKPSDAHFVNTMRKLIDAKKISPKLPHGMKEGHPLYQIGQKLH
eukprot:11716781-Ditylum_brightwellii.AAC.1